MSLFRLAYLALGALGIGGAALLPDAGLRGLAFLLTALLGVLGAVVGIVGNRPAKRLGWWLTTAGLVSFLAGDVMFGLSGLERASDPSVPDALYLAGYPLLLAGLLTVFHRRAERRDWAELIDVGIVVTSVSMLLLLFVLHPVGSAQTGLAGIIAVAYPIGDLCLLAVAVRLLIGRTRRAPAFTLMLVALLASFAANVLNGMLTIGEHDVRTAIGIVSTLLYQVAYLAAGLGVLHPSVHALSGPRRPTFTASTTHRLAALSVALMMGPVAMLGLTLAGRSIDGPVVAPCALILVMLVIARLWLLLKVVERIQMERGRLLEQSMRAIESARSSIASELHDGPIQSLAHIGLNLERVSRQLARDESDKASMMLLGSQESLRNEINRLRRMMTALRPPALDEVGLEAALRDFVAQTARRTGAPCRFEAHLPARLDPDLETVFYRVAQEGLEGGLQRAGTRPVAVILSTGTDGVQLKLVGRRLEPGARERAPDSSALDLMAMRERVELAGGQWSLETTGAGVVIRAWFPRRAQAPSLRPRPAGERVGASSR
jgi:signal transduction histidine kinase